jgi:repressor LexA
MLGRELTKRQREILTFIEERQRSAGFAPTLKETAAHFGFRSANSVRQHLRLIENKGRVKRVPRRSRALVVQAAKGGAHSGLVRVPLLGSIAAGHPILATENVESTFEFPAQFFRGTELFALRVKGASMEGAGILGGDLAILDAAAAVRSGGIGAVLIEDEATLKYVHRGRRRLVLKAANPAFPDIEIDADRSDRIRVMGSLIGVVRSV